MLQVVLSNLSTVYVFLASLFGDSLIRLSVDDAIVTTQCGDVAGRLIDGAYNFRGIPYAEPPTGSRRWKPPMALSPQAGNCWNDTFHATQYGNTCFQKDIMHPDKLIGSEDCLYLNVITPSITPSKLKPVMVWIHGGSLQMLNGNWPGYSPTSRVATDTDMVYVSFNYRLHVFGFMALPILADQVPTNSSGNYGFMDMITVLQWVQNNIHNFGGDPNQVTVFGQSSGGTAIFALLASPLCQGLFHKAWMLSASPILNKTATDAYRDNAIFLKNSGCVDIECLYALSSADVFAAVPWLVYPYWAMEDQFDLPVKGYFDGAVAIVDGIVIPEPPFDSWEFGRGIDVPILIGTTENEVDMNPTAPGLKNWTWTQYEDYVTKKMGTFGEDVLNQTLKLYPSHHISPEYQFTSLVSDIRMTCGNDIMAKTAANGFKSPVYRYVVTYFPSVPVHVIGMQFPAAYAFHIWDLIAFFGFVPDEIEHPTADDLAYQHNVQKEALSFIRTGKPSSEHWLAYPTVTALLSTATTAAHGFHGEQRDFLLNYGFFAYSWIN